MERLALLDRACLLTPAVDGTASADEARDEVVAAVQSGQWSLPLLVSDLEAVLTSQQAEVRQRGLRLIHAVLDRVRPDALQLAAQQVDAMAAFFTQRLSDERYGAGLHNQTTQITAHTTPLSAHCLFPVCCSSDCSCLRESAACLLSLLQSAGTSLSVAAGQAVQRSSQQQHTVHSAHSSA